MTQAGRAGRNWLVDFAVEHWPAIAVGIGTVAMTGLASLASFLQPYGAVGWGGVGIASAVLLSAALWLAAAAHRRWVETRFEVRRAEVTAVNPLDGNFSRRRLSLADFFHPFYQATTAAKFQDCDLLGPAVVVMAGAGSMIRCEFHDCEFVIIKDRITVIGATAFQNCLFDRCKFFRVTFYMTKPEFLAMKKQLPSGSQMKIISDGSAGDL